MPEFLTRINWVDVVIVALFGRVCFMAKEKGFLTEVFKFLGTLSGVYLSLHYFAPLGDFLRESAGITFMPVEFLDFLCFVLLASFGYGIFAVIREAILKVVKMQAVPSLSQWGGVGLGIIRGVLLASLVMFGLVTSSVMYFKKSTVQSYLGPYIIQVAPKVYIGIWQSVMSKFMTGERFNAAVEEIGANIDDFEQHADEKGETLGGPIE